MSAAAAIDVEMGGEVKVGGTAAAPVPSRQPEPAPRHAGFLTAAS